jgi:hypothetical protein
MRFFSALDLTRPSATLSYTGEGNTFCTNWLCYSPKKGRDESTLF